MGEHYWHSIAIFAASCSCSAKCSSNFGFSCCICSPTHFIEKQGLPKACLYMKNCFHKVWNNYQLCLLKFVQATIHPYWSWTFYSCTWWGFFYQTYLFFQVCKAFVSHWILWIWWKSNGLFEVNLIYFSFLIKNCWSGYILMAYKFV